MSRLLRHVSRQYSSFWLNRYSNPSEISNNGGSIFAVAIIAAGGGWLYFSEKNRARPFLSSNYALCDGAMNENAKANNPFDESYFNYNRYLNADEQHPIGHQELPNLDNKASSNLINPNGNGNNRLINLTSSSIADAVEKASPALVNIMVRIHGPFGAEGAAAGSGFIFDSDRRLVATNYHVIMHAVEGDEKLLVTLSQGERFYAKVHSFDRLTDLAILELLGSTYDEETPHEKAHQGLFRRFYSGLTGKRPTSQDLKEDIDDRLPAMKLGVSSTLRPGDWVIALGSPLNMQNTVTAGIVSSVNRQASELGMTQRRTDYIQTDAAINQGNSGGPLINLNGEVIGINTMKVAGTGGIGFAIPIDTARIVLEQLKHKKRVDRPYLGLKMTGVREVRGPHHEPGALQGVLITEVARSSPSQRAGLRAGDIIIKVDDVPIKNTYDVIKIIGYDIGKTHRIEVLTRDGDRKSFPVTSVASAEM